MALIAVALAAAYALHPLGVQHDGESFVRDGEQWLALQVTPARSALVTTNARVQRVRDVLVDDDGTRSAHDVSSRVHDTQMLLRGPGLHSGPVATAWTGVAPAPLSSGPLLLKLRGATYRLQLDCIANAPTCSVVLQGGAGRQVLFELPAGRYDDGTVMLGDDATPSLLFAGDLDHDGRLDLILDTTDHYNVSEPTLYLSSGAEPHALVRKVASHSSTGC
ncbi:hypothetical protein [Lysobacter sp. HA18]